MINYLKYCILFTLMCSLSGCHVFLATGAVTAGQMATDERSAGHIVDDVLLKGRLANRYANDVEQRFTRVAIKVNEGRVLLTGRVATEQNLLAANKIAWEVRGIKELINEIHVGENGSIWSDSKDMVIKSRIKTKYTLRKGFRSKNYNVVVTNGAVYLFGIAQNEAEREVAADIARRIKGVKKVINYVILKDDARRS